MKWNYLILKVEKGKLTRISKKPLAKEVNDAFIGVDIDIVLEVFGNDGWELVNVLGNPKVELQFYLKQPVEG